MLFKDERFGMFLHFGLYSQTAWHEQAQMRLGIPKGEYVKLAKTFDPYAFSADEWVCFAKDNGAQYICFTAKHHDGFCMWDTEYTDYKITNTPFGRDILKELSVACQRYGILLELYYSCPDWHYKHSVNNGGSHELPCPNEGDEPDEEKYILYVKNQMTELMTGYGKISALFWDIPPVRRDPSVNKLVRSLQPDILINDRGYDKGDYSTPERDECIKSASFERLCEACQSVGMQSWGYRENEDYFTPRSLVASVSSILIKGGNYLLNIGPKPDGTLPNEAKSVFAKVGDWYKRIYESISDTKFISLGGHNYTYKDNALYLHLPPAYGSTGVLLNPITAEPKRATLLNDGRKLSAEVEYNPFDYNGKDNTPHLRIYGLPSEKLVGENMVVRLEFDDLKTVFETVTGKSRIIL